MKDPRVKLAMVLNHKQLKQRAETVQKAAVIHNITGQGSEMLRTLREMLKCCVRNEVFSFQTAH